MENPKEKAEEVEKAQRMASLSKQEVISMRETVSRQTNMCKSLNRDVINLQTQNEKYSVMMENAAANNGQLQRELADWKEKAQKAINEAAVYVNKFDQTYVGTEHLLLGLLRQVDGVAAQVLENLNIKHLIICGYASEFCVDVTVKRAAGLGYSKTLVSDGHTTHDKPHLSGVEIRDHHNATLPFITSFGVKIEAVSTQDILLR